MTLRRRVDKKRPIRGFARLLPLLALAACFAWGQPAQPRTVLVGGTVVDGTGRDAFPAAVAFRGGVIEAVGEIQPEPGDIVVDIAGMTVAPGFIDLHNHSTRGLLEEPSAASQVSQGITTLVLGPDGDSPFPPGHYVASLKTKGSAVNVALMVGHGTVRRMVMGRDFQREADASEIEAMAALVRVAMEQGAFGLSSGLEYDPGFYSSTDEIVRLAKVAAEAGGFYMTHIRDEEEGFRQALAEAVQIGKEAGIRVQISHLKLGNTRVWGRTDEALGLLRRAEADGVEVRADCYPYNAWASDLSILVPSRRFDDRGEVADGLLKVGGPGKVLITRHEADPSLEFQTLEAIAKKRASDPVDVFMDLIRQGGASVVCESMSLEDVDAFYRDPLVMVGSDGGIDLRHPRKAGTFTRVLGNFVRQRGVLRLEEAVRKMTRAPAEMLRLKDRGLIASGQRADLVVFDPETVIDRATFQQPDLISEGIVHTFVNGVAVWSKGRTTGRLPGVVLPRGRP